ncbi:MAG: retropepsin-like domain-containing protein, partial [Candidatus Sericytochromatia bacterium]|nr:retropepsin-like domain-containing protein [Candidatus Tanganyikabacteria bacterium]
YGISKFVSVADLAVGATRAELPVVGVLPRLSDRVLKTDGVFIDGILGFDWLKKFRVQIDYKGRKLRLDPHGAPAKPARNRAIIPMEVFNGVPLIPVSINAGPVRQCLIDTGANVVSIRWDMAKASGIKPGDPELQAGPRVRGLAATENTSAIMLKRMKLGGVFFSDVPVSLYQESQLPWMYGKIGNGLFEAFRVTFDARNKQVILER